MDRTKTFGCLMAIVLLGACSQEKHLTVGAKNFTEQNILGEIAAQQIERRTHQRVERRLGLGGSLLAQQALLAREIDLYPEYTGTAFTNILKQDPQNDAALVLDRLRTAYRDWKLQWLDPLGFDNSFAMVVRAADAKSRHLETLSDAANDSQGFILGAGYEFMGRPDGFGMLSKTYGIKWNGSPKTMDLGLLYTALKNKQVDIVAGNATDGPLAALDARILKDDKHVFPPYQACVVVRTEALSEYPNLGAALSELSGKISTESMRKMNDEVDTKHRQPAEVAREFLERSVP